MLAIENNVSRAEHKTAPVQEAAITSMKQPHKCNNVTVCPDAACMKMPKKRQCHISHCHVSHCQRARCVTHPTCSIAPSIFQQKDAMSQLVACYAVPALVLSASRSVRMTWTQMARGGQEGHHSQGQYCCSKSTITMSSCSPSTAAMQATIPSKLVLWLTAMLLLI